MSTGRRQLVVNLSTCRPLFKAAPKLGTPTPPNCKTTESVTLFFPQV